MNLGIIKPTLWGAVGGGAAIAIIGFAWGGWVTGGAAQRMAEDFAQEAVVARLAPICVEQFNQDPNKDRKLKELKKKDVWMMGDYVKKQGWATISGAKEADDEVAGKCAELLVGPDQ